MCWEGSYSLSHGTNLSAGVAILFSPYLNVDILSSVELEKGRLLVVKTKIDEYNFIFVNIYAPNRSADRIILFKRLNEYLRNVNADDFLIVGGDWNSTVDFTLDRNNTEPDFVSPALLKNVIFQNNLLDVWRERNLNVKKYTWVKISQGRISAARLDRFYVCKRTNNSCEHCTM